MSRRDHRLLILPVGSLLVMLVLLLSALAKWRLVGGQLACAVAFFFAVLLIVVVNVLWVIGVLNYLSLGVTPMLIAD